ncbi:hypothetical protein [Deinococcus sp.]|uniref:hypothetical protein n=1 Tax=Deinococcus sp. TaxID=47478 RepID=UPI003C7C70EA
MKYVLSFFRFWYDFIIGDDWTVAAAVVVALLLTALLGHLAGAWAVLPVSVLAFLGVSLYRASRR